jgi:hypothetical protein
VPTLAEQIKKYKNGPGQFETSTEEVQNLAAMKGLPNAPTNAISTNQIGGTPQQAAMAGTPAQTAKAIEQATTPGKSLQTAQRTDQVVAQGPADVTKQRAADLERLGSLGTRVNDLIRSGSVFGAQGGETAIQLKPDLDVASLNLKKEGFDETTFKAKLAEYGKAPSEQGLVDLNGMLGRDATNMLTESQVKDMFVGDVGGALAAATPDKIMMDDKALGVGTDPNNPTLTSFGITKDSLASLIRVSPDDLAKMSLEDLQNKVKQEQATDFSNVGNLQAKLADPGVGDAEKDQIRAQLASLSAGGVTGMEAKAAQTVGQVQNASQVSIGGETFNVAELLSQKGVSELVDRYLSTDELNKDFREQLKKENKPLTDWIDANKGRIEEQIKAVGGSVEKLSEVQAANTAVASTKGGVLSPDVLKLVVPGYGDLTATQIDPSTIPFLKIINDPNNPAPEKLTNALNDLAKAPGMGGNPEVLKELSALSEDDFKKLGMDNPNSNTWPDFLKAKQNQATLDRIPPDNLDQLLDFAFGVDTTPEIASGQFQKANDYAALTGKVDPALQGMRSLLDVNRDGKLDVDNPASIKAALQNYVASGATSVADLLAGKRSNNAAGSVNPLKLDEIVAKAGMDDKLNPIMIHMKDGVIHNLPEKNLESLKSADIMRIYNTVPHTESAAATIKSAIQSVYSKEHGVGDFKEYMDVDTSTGKATLDKSFADKIDSYGAGELQNLVNTFKKDDSISIPDKLYSKIKKAIDKKVEQAKEADYGAGYANVGGIN